MNYTITLTAAESASLATMMRSIDVHEHLVELGKRWPGVSLDDLIDGKAGLIAWLDSIAEQTHAERNRQGWEFIAWACCKTLMNWTVMVVEDR